MSFCKPALILLSRTAQMSEPSRTGFKKRKKEKGARSGSGARYKSECGTLFICSRGPSLSSSAPLSGPRTLARTQPVRGVRFSKNPERKKSTAIAGVSGGGGGRCDGGGLAIIVVEPSGWRGLPAAPFAAAVAWSGQRAWTVARRCAVLGPVTLSTPSDAETVLRRNVRSLGKRPRAADRKKAPDPRLRAASGLELGSTCSAWADPGAVDARTPLLDALRPAGDGRGRLGDQRGPANARRLSAGRHGAAAVRRPRVRRSAAGGPATGRCVLRGGSWTFGFRAGPSG